MSDHKERIGLTDSLQSAVIKMSDGNPGAMGAMVAMIQASPEVDPMSALGSFGPLLSLDMFGIYGSDVYVMHNDLCDRDPVRSLACLRATQLGLLAETDLKTAIAEARERYKSATLDTVAMVATVQAKLPKFAKNWEPPMPVAEAEAPAP